MVVPVNAARGEVDLMIDGRARVLCLTLGALARLEAGLGVVGLAGLEARLRQLSAGDLLVVVAALLADDGLRLSPEEIAASDLSAGAAAEAVARCFEGAA